MSELMELMVFFSTCLSNIFSILDNTYLGNYSILSIFCAMGYISITLWGVFELLDVNNNNERDD